MCVSEARSTDPCPPQDSYRTENGAVNGSSREINEAIEQVTIRESPLCGFQYCEKRRAPLWAVVSLICNAVFLIMIVILSVVLILKMGPETHPACHDQPVNPCPDDWVGYQRRCYYFAEAEKNWTSSKTHCSSLNASLAVVDSQEEMSFMLRYKGPTDHWLGLRKHYPDKPWRWVNGTIFDERFQIRGGGSCAYLDSDGIAGSSCKRNERCICSRTAEREKGLL
nr:C-type lectin domain family 2 member D-like [Pogona vitticeps]XP_020671466.1 C-type lectin domain family 2 member D-like [Pogona vitticeps]